MNRLASCGEVVSSRCMRFEYKRSSWEECVERFCGAGGGEGGEGKEKHKGGRGGGGGQQREGEKEKGYERETKHMRKGREETEQRIRSLICKLYTWVQASLRRWVQSTKRDSSR